MAAPDGSVTVPPTTAFTCALVGRASVREKTTTAAKISSNRFTMRLLFLAMTRCLPAAHFDTKRQSNQSRMYAFDPLVEDYMPLVKTVSTAV
jgi:hypothetical protein